MLLAMPILAALLYVLVLSAFVYGVTRLGRRYVRRAACALDSADETAAQDLLAYIAAKGVDFKMDFAVNRERAGNVLWQ
jgi:hypothetical protein